VTHRVRHAGHQGVVVASPRFCDQLGLGRFELLEDPFDDVFPATKERHRPTGVQVAEGGLVERRGVHDASGGELVDHQLDEADLRRGQTPIA
jgi:hypothetical protein